jgi:hypothetical protein
VSRQSSLMIRRIVEGTEAFPREDNRGCGYWHMHLPVAQAFIDSKRTSKSVRRLCILMLVHRAFHLCTIRPRLRRKTRVVATITLPNLFDSQLIVFFGDDYFTSFFDRDTEEQKWLPLPGDRSLSEEWKLNVPAGFSEKGFREVITNEDQHHDGEIWFIGEL